MRLILGSSSPRRLDLLTQIGIAPDEIRPPNIPEEPYKYEKPLHYAKRLAREKAEALPIASDEIILCADTVVATARRIFEKPSDAKDAEKVLQILSGRRHQVITAIAVRTETKTWLRAVKTVVKFKTLSADEISAYIQSGEWEGKAGGYGIQGRAAEFVSFMSGSYSAVVGLPLYETAQILKAAGLKWPLS